jgi:hypothetical protein
MLQVFDRVMTSRSPETLVMLTVFTVVALVVMAGLDFVRSQLLARGAVALESVDGEARVPRRRSPAKLALFGFGHLDILPADRRALGARARAARWGTRST